MKIIIMKKRTVAAVLALLLLCTALGTFVYFKKAEQTASKNYVAVHSSLKEEFNSIVPGVFILNLTESNYNSTSLMFESLGFDVVEGDYNKYLNTKLPGEILIIDEEDANKLSKKETEAILEKVKGGQCIITEGNSFLSRSLGIVYKGTKRSIKKYTWYSKKDVPVLFDENISMRDFEPGRDNKLLAYTDKNNTPVAVSGAFGNGKFIYSAIPLAPSKGSGYEYFPFIMEAVESEFNIKPVFSRGNGAIYVDPSFHFNEKPSDLAERIKKWGFDQVNLGMWFSIKEKEGFTKSFINECHKRGIMVYAWFEYPMVGVDFWNEHPEWREKTATNEDAHIDWRYLMAMENPDCLKAIKQYTRDILLKFDFDGADIAEIYFEPPGLGFKSPKTFTPMSSSFRSSFEDKYGYDPINIFKPTSKYYWVNNKEAKQQLVDYRIELVTNLHIEMLDLVENIKMKKPYLQTMVTFIDSLYDKDMTEHIGVDSKKLAQLQDKYGFVMQIEDPFTLWKLGPERYKVIGKSYRDIMSKEGKLSIDINIIDRFGNVYPTKKQRGLELYELVNHASQSTDKVMIYSLYTLEKDDMNLFPYAQSYGIKVQDTGDKKYLFDSSKKFTWEIDTEGKKFYLDGKEWPVYNEKGVIIPAGKHTVSFEDIRANGIHIEDINSEITNASMNNGTISLSYNSSGRCFVILNKKPSIVKDGNKVIKPEIVSYGTGFTVTLPSGNHSITIN